MRRLVGPGVLVLLNDIVSVSVDLPPTGNGSYYHYHYYKLRRPGPSSVNNKDVNLHEAQ